LLERIVEASNDDSELSFSSCDSHCASHNQIKLIENMIDGSRNLTAIKESRYYDTILDASVSKHRWNTSRKANFCRSLGSNTACSFHSFCMHII